MIKKLAILIMFLFFASGIAHGAVVNPPRTGQTALPVDLRLALLESISRNVTNDYYFNKKDLCAGNPGNGFRSCFSEQGIEVKSANGALLMSLTAWGRGDSLNEISPVAPHANKARVEYERKGLVEWYLNIPQGVEQGFTVKKAPSGDGKLTLKLQAGAAPMEEEGALRWGSLRYSGLYAVDSTGRELPASFRVKGRDVMIEVDDMDAVYPVIIDPLIEEQTLTASDGSLHEWFGFSVALSGDSNTAIVGAYEADLGLGWVTDEGAAYVFTRSGGVWAEQQKLTASVPWENAHFGQSVALSNDGDTAIVGAHYAHSAYVFTRSGGVWTEQQILRSSPAGGYFGISASLSDDGDTAIVGAWQSNAAYVFTRSGDVWTEQQKLTASDAVFDERLGISASLSGDGNTAIVGAFLTEVEGNINEGAVYVFTRSGDVWTEQQILASLTPSDSVSVALSGDGNTAIVTGYYVYVRSGGIWTEDQILTVGNTAAISGDGNTVIVGNGLATVGDNVRQGAAYVFAAESAPDITVTDSVSPDNDLQVPFGDVTEGATSTQTVTITNNGNEDLVLGDIAAADPLAAPFSLMNDCVDQTLPPGTNCTFQVSFSPTTTGAFDDIFDIPSNDPNEPTVNVALSGVGVVESVPEIDVSPMTLDFNDVVVGESSAPMEVTISNTGTDVLSVSNISPTGTAFSLDIDGGSNPCGRIDPTIAAGGNCTVEFTFMPDQVANFYTLLRIYSDDPDEQTVFLSLSGTGVAAPAPNISVFPLTLDLGEVVVDDSSAPMEVTISNTGTAVLNVSDIQSTSIYSLDIDGGSNPCGMTDPTIASGGNCTVEFTFMPDQVANFYTLLRIYSNDPDEPTVEVYLSGAGLDNITTPITGAAGTGTITIDTSGNPGTTFSDVYTYADTDPMLNQTGNPADQEFPDGLVAFKVNGVDPGGTVEITIAFPTTFPSGAKYYKVDSNGFYEFTGAVINGDTVTLTLTDGGSGDADNGLINGQIVDPGGVAVPNNNPPSKSGLVYPANGQTGLPSSFTFIWEESTDPDGDPIAYTLYYCDNENVESCEPTTVASAASFENKGIFYGSIAGNWLFIVIGMLLVGALKGKKGLGICLLTAMLMIGGGLTLSACGRGGFDDSTTPAAGAPPAQPTPGDGEAGYTVSGLSSGTTYYWKVAAADNNGGSKDSEIWSFTTQTQ